MSLYIPIIQTEYLVPGLLDNRAYAQLVAAGVLDTETCAITQKAGDYVTIPTVYRPDDFIHMTVAGTSAINPNAIDAKTDKAVIISDISTNQFYESDLRRVDNALGEKFVRGYGAKLAKRFVNIGLAGTAAQIKAMTSYRHNYSCGNGGGSVTTPTANMTVANFKAGRLLMADYADELDTAVMHSSVWSDLLADVLANYKVASVTWDDAIASAQLGTLLGIRKFVITDLVPVGTGATSSTGDDIYHTFLLASRETLGEGEKGPIAEAFQENPLMEESGLNGVGMTNADTIHYLKMTMRHIWHLKGLAWNSTANPTDANYATYSYYTAAYQDHRDVKAVDILSLATKAV